jgi:hypothetical protein
MIDVSYEIIELKVFPEKEGFSNVVGKVRLKTIFSRNGVSTYGMIEALLNTDDLSSESFIAVENLDVATVAAWALAANGGDSFLTSLKNIHDPLLTEKQKEIGLVRYESP